MLTSAEEHAQNLKIASASVSLLKALATQDSETIAEALYLYEFPSRTKTRFEYIIKWEILGKEKVALWKEIKRLYDEKE